MKIRHYLNQYRGDYNQTMDSDLVIDKRKLFTAPQLAPYRIKPGEVRNPTGRRKGEVYISEAVRALVAGDEPTSNAPVWRIAKNILKSLEDKRLDSRILSLVLDRLEGKVPERIEATVAQGVVFVPAEQMAADAWSELAAATLAAQGPSVAGVLEAAVVRRGGAEDDADD